MIDEATASLQVQRFVGLRGFPTAAAGQRELIRAMQGCVDARAAQSIADDWLSTETQSPYPTDIRRKISEQPHARKARCPECNGDGWLPRVKLVTYKSNSFALDASEDITHMTYADQLDLRSKLHGPNAQPTPGLKRQDILSCVVPCRCLSPTHKALTEGR